MRTGWRIDRLTHPPPPGCSPSGFALARRIEMATTARGHHLLPNESGTACWLASAADMSRRGYQPANFCQSRLSSALRPLTESGVQPIPSPTLPPSYSPYPTRKLHMVTSSYGGSILAIALRNVIADARLSSYPKMMKRTTSHHWPPPLRDDLQPRPARGFLCNLRAAPKAVRRSDLERLHATSLGVLPIPAGPPARLHRCYLKGFTMLQGGMAISCLNRFARLSAMYIL